MMGIAVFFYALSAALGAFQAGFMFLVALHGFAAVAGLLDVYLNFKRQS